MRPVFGKFPIVLVAQKYMGRAPTIRDVDGTMPRGSFASPVARLNSRLLMLRAATDQIDENHLQVQRVRRAADSVSRRLDGYDLGTGDPPP